MKTLILGLAIIVSLIFTPAFSLSIRGAKIPAQNQIGTKDIFLTSPKAFGCAGKMFYRSSPPALNPFFPGEKECQWSGTVSAVITGKKTDTRDVFDLGKTTENTDFHMTVNAKISFGEATETVEFNRTTLGKTIGKQFCGSNAQPKYADYNETTTATKTGSGSGEAELSVDVHEASKTYSIQIKPEFEYELTNVYKKEISSQCPDSQLQGDNRTSSETGKSGIWIPQIPLESSNADVLKGSKTMTLIDDSTAVYTWSLSRCQSCEIKAKEANTNRLLSENDLKAYGYDAGNSGKTQTLKTVAGQRLEITMHDGSIIRIAPNSVVELDPCEESNPGKKPVTVKTILGTVWVHVIKAVGGDLNYQVQTERAIVGVRGTTFEVSYNPTSEISTVHVIEGTVSFGDLNLENSILVTAGQTAQMKGDGMPILKSTLTQTKKQ